MISRWKRTGAAAILLGLVLGFAENLHAQYPPMVGAPPFGGRGPGDPTPVAGGPPEMPMPPFGPNGPMPPGGPSGPGGPKDGLNGPGNPSIPELTSGPNAWQGDYWGNNGGWYVSGGALGLQRFQLPHRPVGVTSTPLATGAVSAPTTGTFNVPITYQASNGQIAHGTVPVSVTYTAPVFNTESGAPFQSGAPRFGDYNDLHFSYAWGGSAAVGMLADDHSSVEFSGYYLPESSSRLVLGGGSFVAPTGQITILAVGAIPSPGGSILSVGSIPDAVAGQLPGTSSGRLNLAFFNAPVGFEGNNGLWTEADRVAINFQTTMGNAEANYRFSPGGIFQPLIGFRYLDETERLSIATSDDAFTNPSPVTSATYATHTHNRIFAAQLGMELNVPVLSFLTISGVAKGAWGANFLTSDVSLVRGDGFVGFEGHRDSSTFSHIYEAGLFLDFYFLQRARIHAGYTGLWLPRITRAVDQIDYDLSHQNGHVNDAGNAFYHGPVIELQFLF